MKKLYKLQHERYELIQELQGLIAQQSKPEELSHSIDSPKNNKNPLTWMIVGVRNNEGTIFDTNQNPLHKKLMEIYYKEHEIDDAERDWLERFVNGKFKGLRQRINALERSRKGRNEKITYLVKEINKLKDIQEKKRGED